MIRYSPAAGFAEYQDSFVIQRPRNLAADGARPTAQAYAGHQYGGFTMLGDGRAILLGEHRTPSGRRVARDQVVLDRIRLDVFAGETLVIVGTEFSDGFLVIAAIVLALDLFVGLATLGRIYANALKLKLRGAPFHPHPRPAER